MNEWIDELTDLTAAGEPAVLVTVAGIRGSAPISESVRCSRVLSSELGGLRGTVAFTIVGAGLRTSLKGSIFAVMIYSTVAFLDGNRSV